MGGMGLISSGFLAVGALLATVPILLHLLFRPKARRIDIGSLRFLRIAVRDNAHRRKIRRWLLLAARVAAVLLLGLLFARPYRVEPKVAGEDREVAILIDRSASMAAGSDHSSYDRARDEATKLVASLPEGTSINLGLFDETGIEVVSSGNPGSTSPKPGLTGTDFARGLAWARDRLLASNRKIREVHVFTDLQRAGLDHPADSEFPEGIEVEIHDVGRPIRANLAVVDAGAVRSEIRPGAPSLVSAVVFNAGSFPVQNVEVKLALEGSGEKVRLSERISIDALSRKEVRFRPSLTKPGIYRGTVAVPHDDDFAFDDIRWLAFEAKKPDSILLVDGEPGSSVYTNETYYLEAALRLRLGDKGSPSTPYEPRRVIVDDRAGWSSLADTQVVVLANVAEVSAEVASSLRGFVESGGSLVIFSGLRDEPGSLSTLKAARLLPAEFEGIAVGPFRFGSWKADHPIFEPFADPQHGDLRTLRFVRIAKLKPTPGSVVLATTNDGQPLLVENKIGSGRILQWATAADNDWGDWAIQRLYLPLIHQLVGYLTGRLDGTGAIRNAMISAVETPGIEVVSGGLLVRNTNPAESRIEKASLAEFRSSLRLPEPKDRPKGESGPAEVTEAGTERPGEFWNAVAWVLMVVLVVETFLANRTHV